MTNGKKKPLKSHKNFKRYRCSWQHHQYRRPSTTEYYEKVKRAYESLPGKLANPDRRERMLLALLHDTFAYVHRRDYTKDRTVRREDLDIIRCILDDYRGYGLLYVAEGKLPDGAIPLREGSRLCFTNANKYGMPFEQFLLYLLGDSFSDKKERFAALGDDTGIPPERMEDIYLDVITAFFLDQARKRHRKAAKYSGGDLGFLHCEDFNVVYNYNIEASSGATVNINR